MFFHFVNSSVWSLTIVKSVTKCIQILLLWVLWANLCFYSKFQIQHCLKQTKLCIYHLFKPFSPKYHMITTWLAHHFVVISRGQKWWANHVIITWYLGENGSPKYHMIITWLGRGCMNLVEVGWVLYRLGEFGTDWVSLMEPVWVWSMLCESCIGWVSLA